MRHIPISLHAKFQGNQTIHQGEKTKTHRQTERHTDTLEFKYILAEGTRLRATRI